MIDPLAAFLRYLTVERQASPHTVRSYRSDLEQFVAFCDRYYGGQWTFESVDRLGVRGFLGEFERRGLRRRSAARALSALRSFYRYLHANHGVPGGAVRAARSPKIEKRLPTHLRTAEVDVLFAHAEGEAAGGDPLAVRDLAILELFYSSGLRLSELQGLDLGALDLLSDQVKVKGKGRKERIVPVGSRAVAALRRYLLAREELARRPRADRAAVFLARNGRALAVFSQNGARFGFECLFGEIVDGAMRLNELGQAVEAVWCDLPDRFHHVSLDEYVIMPNHFHGILFITDVVG